LHVPTRRRPISTLAYAWTHRPIRQVLCLSPLFIAMTSFSLVASLVGRSDLTSTPVLLAAIGGSLLGQWLGGAVGPCFLPGSRLSGGILWSIAVIGLAGAMGGYHWMLVEVFATYALIFWFSRAAEELLRTLVPPKRRARVFALYGVLFAMAFIAGVFPAAGLMDARPDLARPAGWIGLAALGVLWVVTMVTQSRRPPVQGVSWLLFHIAYPLARLYHGLTTPGGNRLPARGGVVLASIHRSAIDPMYLQTLCRRPLHWMVAQEYFHVRWLGWIFRQTGSVPVNRTGQDTAATRQAIRLLRAGEVVAIFPYGDIRDPGQPEPELKEGAALLALVTGSALVPAGIVGIDHRGVVADWLLPHRGVRVKIGQPIDLKDLAGRSHDRAAVAEATRRLAEALRQLEVELAGESTYNQGNRGTDG
jgi:1-acyl-sn-glycerol-3-phosphate acyltransferase